MMSTDLTEGKATQDEDWVYQKLEGTELTKGGGTERNYKRKVEKKRRRIPGAG
jgi:hypothetical protein